MSRRERIKGLYALPTEGEKLAMANSPPTPAHPIQRVHAGPVRSMGLALDRMEQETRALHDVLAAGSAIVELDPDLIEPSIIRDRLPDSGAASFEALRKSIEDHGQEVPILVRPHPIVDGRFQVAFGHRRLKAVASLGRKVRAVVRSMTDIDLVTAQGVENSHREGLSYIERAVFAARLEDKGFARSVIVNALATDKTELSKLISVARAVPDAVIEAIGPAPKAGRRRWLAFAELLGTAAVRRAVEKAAKDPDIAKADTDTRFVRIFAAVSTRSQPSISSWQSEGGNASVRVTRTMSALNLAFDLTREPAFAEFVASRLDQLYQEFQVVAQAAD
jgi:ParB family chromosome partitioning protein